MATYKVDNSNIKISVTDRHKHCDNLLWNQLQCVTI